MSIDARLKKLMPVLTAKERAILLLQAWRDDTPEDPSWRATMPPGQVREFNYLIDLMNGAMIHMAAYITVVELLIEKMEMKMCWLVALKLWEEQIQMISRAVRIGLNEPITQSDYDAEQRRLNETWVPVEELAELLTEEHTGWQREDYDEADGDDEPDISDAAWERVFAEKERDLRRLVKAGTLTGKGRGANLSIQEGPFNRWAGRSTVPAPEQVLGYEVRPDADQGCVEREVKRRQWLYETLEWQPLTIKGDPEPTGLRDRLMGHLRSSLSDTYNDAWKTLRAIEVITEEATSIFEGCVPLRREKQSQLTSMTAKLAGLGRELSYLDVAINTPEPDEELLGLLRHMVRLDH